MLTLELQTRIPKVNIKHIGCSGFWHGWEVDCCSPEWDGSGIRILCYWNNIGFTKRRDRSITG